jgi:hypothetical protein
VTSSSTLSDKGRQRITTPDPYSTTLSSHAKRHTFNVGCATSWTDRRRDRQMVRIDEELCAREHVKFNGSIQLSKMIYARFLVYIRLHTPGPKVRHCGRRCNRKCHFSRSLIRMHHLAGTHGSNMPSMAVPRDDPESRLPLVARSDLSLMTRFSR